MLVTDLGSTSLLSANDQGSTETSYLFPQGPSFVLPFKVQETIFYSRIGGSKDVSGFHPNS